VRKDRKMGHVTALGATRDEALERARRASRLVRIEAAPADAGEESA